MMSTSACSNAIALFVRHPVAGRVKTRLACDIGDENACCLYIAMVADVLASIAACNVPLYLFHDGNDGLGLPEAWLAAAYAVFAQKGDALDERMSAAFEQLFAAGIERVVLAGSDIPGIDTCLLRSAIEALDNNDVVFVPACDGGYCLVAFRNDRYTGKIFSNIPWSTELVMEKTLEACRREKLGYSLLDYRRDIDTVQDLLEYCRNPSPDSPATNQWLVAAGYLAAVSTSP